MLFKKYAFYFLFNIILVECAISSFNNKYSNKQTLTSIAVDNGRIDFVGRFKRNTNHRDAHSSADNLATTEESNTHINKTAFHGEHEPEITITSFELKDSQKSHQAFIHWIGKGKSERIIVLTCTVDFTVGPRHVVQSQVWRSNDYGISFQKINFSSSKDIEKEPKISYFYTFAKNDKKLLFADAEAKKVYTTTDELDSWNVFDVPVEPDVVLPHPNDENKILLYNLNQRKLFVSLDFAKNWKLLSENVLPNFYWGEKDFDDDDLVHMEIDAGMPLHAYYKVCKVTDCKEGAVEELGPFLADSLIVYREYMFVQKSSVDSTDNFLMVSYNRGSFQKAYFPGDLKTDDFILLNLENGQVFIAVNHGDNVNLYLSDVTGQFYVLSFSNIYHIMRYKSFEVDLHEVQGMNWTFLANKKEATGVRTYISFDKGGNWSVLNLNRSCTVVEECALYLQVRPFPLLTSVLSQENAPGIIMAHGMVGTNFKDQETFVFTSRDGGATWLKAKLSDGTPIKGDFHFNILDQGSVLTAVSDGLLNGLSTKTVYYSFDEGGHWKQENFHSTGLVVKGVLTEPGSLTMVQSVFGNEDRNKPWMVIKLNFSTALIVKCKPGDYEQWNPSDYYNVKPGGNRCILGQVVMYNRRKADANCYNGYDVINRTVLNETCACTPEDFECDFGYDKDGEDCKQAKWFDDTFSPPECDSGGTYLKSQGYRKVPADKCFEKASEMQKYDKVKTDCSAATPTNLSIVVKVKKVASGSNVTFHLEQAAGSKFDTKYTWNFGDGTDPVEDTSFQNASVKKHQFQVAGHYFVNVTAENKKGKTNASALIYVQDPLYSAYFVAPSAAKTGVPVAFSVYPSSSASKLKANLDIVHYAWSFGDEDIGIRPMLDWNNSVSHVYRKAGTYTMSVEAINSVSSTYKEHSIQIYDDAEILVLTFSNNVDSYNMTNPIIAELFTLRIRQHLAEELGVKLARLEAVIISIRPTVAHLYIFPSSDPGEQSISNIVNTIIDEVQKGDLAVNLFGKTYEAGIMISITSAKLLSSTDHSSTLNLKAVYIAAPILVLAVIVSFVSFMYCRKKLHNRRQYNILNAQDDSDALLDDDDEAPLDLNVDFGVRESSRDDSILNTGNLFA